MFRPTREEVEDKILDRAAALFAIHGFAKTSVQGVAEAVGLSKAGLLHHFSSKEALHEAVVSRTDRLGRRLLDAVGDVPPGRARDEQVIELVVDIALTYPGLVSLLMASATEDRLRNPMTRDAGYLVMLALGVDMLVPVEQQDTGRTVAVIAALSAIAVLAISATAQSRVAQWRPHIISAALGALGYTTHPALSSTPTT